MYISSCIPFLIQMVAYTRQFIPPCYFTLKRYIMEITPQEYLYDSHFFMQSHRTLFCPYTIMSLSSTKLVAIWIGSNHLLLQQVLRWICFCINIFRFFPESTCLGSQNWDCWVKGEILLETGKYPCMLIVSFLFATLNV